MAYQKKQAGWNFAFRPNKLHKRNAYACAIFRGPRSKASKDQNHEPERRRSIRAGLKSANKDALV